MRLIDADALIQTLNDKEIPYNADINEAIRKAPTVETKRYQMSQFEYDLIKSCKEATYEGLRIEEFAFLRYMQSLGYLKNVPKYIRIRDILENAEVER